MTQSLPVTGAVDVRQPQGHGRSNAAAGSHTARAAANSRPRQTAAARRAFGHHRRQHPGHHAAADARRRSGLGGLDGLVAEDDVSARTGPAGDAGATASNRTSRSRGVTQLSSIPGPAGTIPCAALPRRRRRAAPLLVFYHGGGHGDRRPGHPRRPVPARSAATAAMHVLSVDYRLAPEHKAPAGADDAFARVHCGRATTPPSWGPTRRAWRSAATARGGNLAALVSLRARDEEQRLPALQLLIYPVTDYRDETRSQTLFADGYFLTKHDLDWFRAQVTSTARTSTHRTRGCRRCWPTTCPGCRPRWCSPAGSIRCATRAGSTPMPCGRAGVHRRPSRSSDRLCTGSRTSSRSAAAARRPTTEMISALRAHLARA